MFTTLALLNITQFTMGKFLYLAVQSSSECWVSIKRMEAILLLEVLLYIRTYASIDMFPPPPTSAFIVHVESAFYGRAVPQNKKKTQEKSHVNSCRLHRN